MIPIPAFLTSKTAGILAIVAVVATVYGAGYFHGRTAVNERVERDRADEYSAVIEKAKLTLEAALVKEIEGREHEDRIEHTYARAVIDLRNTCRLDDIERVHFNEAIAAFNRSNAVTVPSGMPGTEADG